MLNNKKMFTKILNALQGKTGLPDYDKATTLSFSWNTDTTIADDGYVVVTMTTSQDGAYMSASVNGLAVWSAIGGTNNQRNYVGVFPVCKGDIIKFTYAYTVTGTAKFVPYK